MLTLVGCFGLPVSVLLVLLVLVRYGSRAVVVCVNVAQLSCVLRVHLGVAVTAVAERALVSDSFWYNENFGFKAIDYIA